MRFEDNKNSTITKFKILFVMEQKKILLYEADNDDEDE